jgi:sugar phosphate isomerase/epimerase
MKYCMMTYTCARQGMKMPEICQLAQDLGLDAMDQVGLQEWTAAQTRKMAADHGLQIICYTFMTQVNHEDDKLRLAGLDAYKRELDVALELGAPMIMLPLPGKAQYTRSQSRRNIMKSMPAMAQLARAAGLVLTIENFPGETSPFTISDDMEEVIRYIPSVRITFDNGNVLTGGEDPCDGFARTRQWIVHSHFKDYSLAREGEKCLIGLDGRKYKPALIGEGLVDYTALMKAMIDAGYAGYVNIEYEGNEYTASDAMKRALAHLVSLEESLSAAAGECK